MYNDYHIERLSSLGSKADTVVAFTANVQMIQFVL